MEEVPPEFVSRPMSVSPSDDIMEQAAGRASPAPTHVQAGPALPARLADAPQQGLQVVHQLARPATGPHQQVQRLQLLQQTLELLDRRQLPQLRAMLQENRASSLHRSRIGDQAENLARAVIA
jgi:hypothetical protein